MRIVSGAQAVTLVLLRTLIGWHFLYEGYYKLMLPGWTHAGAPLAGWSAAGFLKAASGPLGGVFRALGQSGAAPWIDIVIPLALVAIGLSLLLGLPLATVYTLLRRGKARLADLVDELSDSPRLVESTMMGLETWALKIRAHISE